MNLELTNIRKRGRVDKTPIPLDVRPLTADSVANASQREAGIKPDALTRITVRHRAIARRIAAGASTGEVAAEFGLTASRISVLKADRTFQDLVEWYTVAGDREFEEAHRTLANLTQATAEELLERVLEEPEELDTSELTKLLQIAADRTGHAPKRVEEKTVNFNFGDRLEQARARAREMITIEASAEEIEQ